MFISNNCTSFHLWWKKNLAKHRSLKRLCRWNIYMFGFTSTGFILIVLWYVLLYLLTISYNLSIETFFENESCIFRFNFYGSNECFSNNRFSFIMRWIYFYIIFFLPWFHWSIVKFTTFIDPNFNWLAIRFF